LQDKRVANNLKIDAYVVTPSGAGKRYDFDTKKITTEFDVLPEVESVDK